MNLFPFIRVLVVLSLLGVLILTVKAEETTVFLKPPGLRLIKDPSTTIPALYQYPNQTLALPDYRDLSGKPRDGWDMEVIKTHRFFSNQSARLYFRISDLARSKVHRRPDVGWDMRIWPLGTFIIMEVYEGNASLEQDAKPIKVAAMAKMEGLGTPSSASLYPVDWSYAKFTPEGTPFLPPDEVQECHQCHSTAFHVTGDLIFTQFP